MKAQDLKPGHVLVEHGHEFTITAVEPTGTGHLRVRSTLPGCAPHVHLFAPDTEVETMTRITVDQLHDDARTKFGSNPQKWAYRCPVCGHVATGPDIAWMLSQQPAETAARFPARVDQVLARWCLRCGATADEYGTTTVTLPTGQQVRVFELASKETP